MPRANLNIAVSMGGVSIARPNGSREADGGVQFAVTLPKAFAGELTTRTDNDSGVITLEDGDHTLVTSDVVDIYWQVNGVWLVRYGMVASVSGSVLTVNDDGAGENLPALNSDVIVAKTVEIATFIDGDELLLLALYNELPQTTLDGVAHLDMEDSSSSIVQRLLYAGKPFVADVDAGAVSGLESQDPVVIVRASQSNTTVDSSLKCIAVYDSTN